MSTSAITVAIAVGIIGLCWGAGATISHLADNRLAKQIMMRDHEPVPGKPGWWCIRTTPQEPDPPDSLIEEKR